MLSGILSASKTNIGLLWLFLRRAYAHATALRSANDGSAGYTMARLVSKQLLILMSLRLAVLFLSRARNEVDFTFSHIAGLSRSRQMSSDTVNNVLTCIFKNLPSDKSFLVRLRVTVPMESGVRRAL